MNVFSSINSLEPLPCNSRPGIYSAYESGNNTHFGFSSPELASMQDPFPMTSTAENPLMLPATVAVLGTWTPFGTMRLCRPGEKYVKGEMVGMQSSPYVQPYPVQVGRIDRQGIEFLDPQSGTMYHLPFDCFYKIDPLSNAAPSPVPSPSVLVPTPQPQRQLDSVSSLVREFSQREFVSQPFKGCSVYGYRATEDQMIRDKQRLVQILTAHNGQFATRILSETDRETYAGMTEKLRFPSGTHIYVRADLHSDLASLIEQLKLLQRLRYLDENSTCRPGFSVIFLGDYVDRGVNDISILSLLLSFRMSNPTSVHLLRGNHESIEVSSFFSSDVSFLMENQKLFQDCFESFPMSLSIATEEPYVKAPGLAKHQFVHFSHGLFSPAELGETFSKGSVGLSLVPKHQNFKDLQRGSEKANRAFLKLATKYHDIPQALGCQGYMWSDIARVSGPSCRGLGYVFSPDDIRLSLRSADFRSSDDYNEICACFRGHEHEYKEHEVPRKEGSRHGTYKVIATTLPVAMSTGFYQQAMPVQQVQGFMLTIRPKAGAWEKTPVLLDIDERTCLPKLRFHEKSFTLYERLDAEINEKVEEQEVLFKFIEPDASSQVERGAVATSEKKAPRAAEAPF